MHSLKAYFANGLLAIGAIIATMFLFPNPGQSIPQQEDDKSRFPRKAPMLSLVVTSCVRS